MASGSASWVPRSILWDFLSFRRKALDPPRISVQVGLHFHANLHVYRLPVFQCGLETPLSNGFKSLGVEPKA
jgi:hypothetical protein